jgi:hypothetical protein
VRRGTLRLRGIRPVLNCELVSQDIPLHMAYIDVKPTTPTDASSSCLHGKHCVAATWLGENLTGSVSSPSLA